MIFERAFLAVFLATTLLLTSGLIADCARAETPSACAEWAADLVELKAHRWEAYYARTEQDREEIIEQLRAAGLHPKWLYLMLVESGGEASAQSGKGAAGPWQLTAATAAHYGCRDRSDIVESTAAAARYLRKLLRDFDGDEWSVAAAYNQGGHNLRAHGATSEARALADLVICLFSLDPLSIRSMD